MKADNTTAHERRFRLRLLDGFRLECAGQPVTVPKGARRLIAFLGVRGDSTRSETAGILWPEVSEDHAHGCLRTTLWRLRGFDGELITRGLDALAIGEEVAVDVCDFVTAARRTLADMHNTSTPPPPALINVGELLPGWYDDWVLFERERLRQLQLHALETLARWLCVRGRYAEAVDTALNAIRMEPLRESSTRVLITVHLAEHNVVEALHRFTVFRRALASELGIEPSHDLRDIVERATGPMSAPSGRDRFARSGEKPH